MLKVAYGTYKGYKLISPPWKKTRSTTHFLRLQLMNILQHPDFPDVQTATVADICAGSGAVGIEFLSVGAHVDFVERNFSVLSVLRKNIQQLSVSQDQYKIFPYNALKLPKATMGYTYVFLDPPYNKNMVSPMIQQLITNGWMDQYTWLIIQHDKTENIEDSIDNSLNDPAHDPKQKIVCWDQRLSGQTQLSFYRFKEP